MCIYIYTDIHKCLFLLFYWVSEELCLVEEHCVWFIILLPLVASWWRAHFSMQVLYFVACMWRTFLWFKQQLLFSSGLPFIPGMNWHFTDGVFSHVHL